MWRLQLDRCHRGEAGEFRKMYMRQSEIHALSTLQARQKEKGPTLPDMQWNGRGANT